MVTKTVYSVGVSPSDRATTLQAAYPGSSTSSDPSGPIVSSAAFFQIELSVQLA